MITRYSREEMASIWSPEYRFRKWLDVEIAVCEALHEQGEIPEKSLEKIKEKADFSLEEIHKKEEENHHEVIAFLQVVQKKVGKDARYIHAGLTSSDVMDTATALQMVESHELIVKGVEKMADVLMRLAMKYKYTPIIGRTHNMHAEPTTFGLKLAIFYAEFGRHLVRLKEIKPRITIGKISGAVGNYSQIEPITEENALKRLGLTPAEVTNQVLQRDRHAEFVSVCALIAGTCEKLASEVRNLQRTEIDELEEPFAAKQKGSSAMPHKRNPVKSEQICGIARIIRGAVIPALENIALWHERDISHSSAERIILPDVCIGLDYILFQLHYIIDGMAVKTEHMKDNIDVSKGLVFSQRLMLRLVSAGMDRNKAHTMIQGKAMAAIKRDDDFRNEVIKDGEIRRYLTLEEIEAMFDLDLYIRHVDTIFKRVFK